MAGRPTGSSNVRTIDFFRRFDELSKQHIDPLEFMFKIAAKSSGAGRGWTANHRITAAQTLLAYRYPKLKTVEIMDNSESAKVQISWLDDDGDSLRPDPGPVGGQSDAFH